ncbi:MAG: alanine racemase [Planctomycetota bacterium]|jgi:predicted amino acid racemase|nr:alanine racemase [Planctomycetota bacterium]
MFLSVLIRRNPAFLGAVITLHQRGELPANCYVIDADAVRENARLLAASGEKNKVEVLGMTKQIGRCPPAVKAMVAGGVRSFVAVDMDDARALHRHGFRIGHLGHLVQIPRSDADAAVAMRPDYITVFSIEKAVEAAAAARARGVTQNILIRVHAPGDRFYKGHEGGFPAESATDAAKRIASIDGLRFAGVTTFPALLFAEEEKAVTPTPNLSTLGKVAEALGRAGFKDLVINAPGTTSSEVMAKLAEEGATQVEPGHALTGTTPLHAVRELPESPAVVYLSEIAHVYNGSPYCFGGGLYIDPVFPGYRAEALVGSDPDQAFANRIQVEFPPANAIDYYGILHPNGKPAASGDSVVFGFRPQAFVTRAYVSAISGAASENPRVEGIWKSDGSRSEWPF